MGKERRFIIGSGNAIKRNKVLQEIIQQTFQMDLKLSPYQEEASYGAALLSMKAGGYGRPVKDANKSQPVYFSAPAFFCLDR